MSLYLSGEKLEPAKTTGTKNLLESFGLMDSYNDFTKGKLSSSFKSYIRHLAGYSNYSSRSSTPTPSTSLSPLITNMPPIEHETPLDLQPLWATTTSFVLQDGGYKRDITEEEEKKHKKKKKKKKKKHSSTDASTSAPTNNTTITSTTTNGDPTQPTQNTTTVAETETSTKKHKKKRSRTEGAEGEHKSSKKKRKKDKEKDKDKEKEKEKKEKEKEKEKEKAASVPSNPTSIPLTQNITADPSQGALR